MDFRQESDSMGHVKVPSDAYWGAQTQRSLENFKIGDEKLPNSFFKAYALVKKSAAKVNAKHDKLEKSVLDLITKACDDIIAGQLSDQFPLVVWQTGSGTQSNMNVNEVISNRAIELASGERGGKTPVHPNDHVNKSQSTNDSFPTAMYVAAAVAVKEILEPSVNQILKTFENKSEQFKDVIKMGRTHLQDATPLTLGQEISAWHSQLEDALATLNAVMPQVYSLAIGGTAVGTGLNTHPDYAELTVKEIAKETGLPFVAAKNKFAGLSAHDAMVSLSGVLNTLACALMKIANDIRWLSSGPRGGLGEISIAENEPGSSIMPGKVNPTQAEALTMVCAQVMGNHTTVSVAGSQGNFQLNVYKPVIIYNILQSINLLSDAVSSFDTHCAKSIEPNHGKLLELKDKSLMLVTALAPHLGYDKAAKAAKHAHAENLTLKEAMTTLGLLDEQKFDELVRPEDMLGPKA